MIDKDKINDVIQLKIGDMHRLGEQTGTTDHVAYRSFTKFELSDPKEFQFEGKIAFEVVAIYNIYTETEFLHHPDNDHLYNEHWEDTFIVDENYKILDIKSK